jgi:hypothetical protein
MKISKPLERGKFLGFLASFSFRARVTEYLIESDHVAFIADPLWLSASSDAPDRKEVSQIPLSWLTPHIGVRTFKLKQSVGAIEEDILLDKSNPGGDTKSRVRS